MLENSFIQIVHFRISQKEKKRKEKLMKIKEDHSMSHNARGKITIY